jgi:acetolactate synthase I/II/III large subunit
MPGVAGTWETSAPEDSEGLAMSEVDGGALVGQVLKEQKVKYLFSINGGHTLPILGQLTANDVKLIHMRHEQATAYAADGWARSTGTPGVCCVTAGCGLTNTITGLAVAALTNSAVVCLSGQHPTIEDGLDSFQELYGSEICRTFAKYTRRILDWSTIEFHLRQAFRAAASPPQGVAVVEIPQNVLYRTGQEPDQRGGARVYGPDELRAQGDPRAVERAVQLLLGAERPLLVGGDGVFWSDAGPELRELAELTSTPVYSRRAGQGALAEDHPLAVRGAWKKPFTGRADVVVSFGFRFWSGEHFGQPPTWGSDATHVQVDSDPRRVGSNVDADVPIVGDPKLVLRQMIELVRGQGGVDRSGSGWLAEVAEARARFEGMVADREEQHHGDVPVHPDRLMHDLVSVLDPSAVMIVDSFTLSGYVSHWFAARFPGQLIDAGPLAPVGHSIGMAIGAGLARPGSPVVALIGDGGLGIGGFDLETAARYNIPIVVVLWNNSSWGPSFEQMPRLRGRTEPFDMLPDIRYDRIAEELGCHGEHVEDPDGIRPALERAFASGKPALVNIIGDKRIGHPTLGGNLLGSTGS